MLVSGRGKRRRSDRGPEDGFGDPGPAPDQPGWERPDGYGAAGTGDPDGTSPYQQDWADQAGGYASNPYATGEHQVTDAYATGGYPTEYPADPYTATDPHQGYPADQSGYEQSPGQYADPYQQHAEQPYPEQYPATPADGYDPYAAGGYPAPNGDGTAVWDQDATQQWSPDQTDWEQTSQAGPPYQAAGAEAGQWDDGSARWEPSGQQGPAEPGWSETGTWETDQAAGAGWAPETPVDQGLKAEPAAAETAGGQQSSRRSKRAERTEGPELAQPTPEPLQVNEVAVVTAGTIAWGVAFVVLLVFRNRLATLGYGWWVWTCCAGVGLGLFGMYYVRRRQGAAGPRPVGSTAATEPAPDEAEPQEEAQPYEVPPVPPAAPVDDGFPAPPPAPWQAEGEPDWDGGQADQAPWDQNGQYRPPAGP